MGDARLRLARPKAATRRKSLLGHTQYGLLTAFLSGEARLGRGMYGKTRADAQTMRNNEFYG